MTNELHYLAGYRFPLEIISYALWLYHNFSLSYREVEVLLRERGIEVSYESIRNWSEKFGPNMAKKMKIRRGKPTDKYHLDEMEVKIKGKTHYIWRAVDSEGYMLDVMVQEHKDQAAAERFLKKLIDNHGEPRVMITDKNPSYGAAKSGLRLTVDHRQHKGLNNRAELSHQPIRQQERAMRKFKSKDQAQCFLDKHQEYYNCFRLRKRKMSAQQYRDKIDQSFAMYRNIVQQRCVG